MLDDPSYLKCKDILYASRDYLLQRPDVNSVSISHKMVKGLNTNRLAIKISVSRKRPEHELSPEELLPKEIGGCPTDVVEEELVEPKGFRNQEYETKEEV